MDMALTATLALAGVIVLTFAILALRAPILLKLALRNLVKRKRSSAYAVCGLMVSASIISGALAVGDSMENAVVQSVYSNLGEVDEAVLSYRSFNASMIDALKADDELTALIDGAAPLIILPASVSNAVTGLREARATVVGFDGSFLVMGGFEFLSGASVSTEPSPGEAFINEELATSIGIHPGENITLSLRNPEFSIETIYSALEGLTNASFNVSGIVANSGLGRFQLNGRSAVPAGVFVNLSHLQAVLGMGSRVNTAVLSNRGGAGEGLELSDQVVHRVGQLLDDEIGYLDLGFNVSAEGGYARVENRDIFFQGRYFDAVGSFVQASDTADMASPLSTYFVNTMIGDASSIYYSVVTGFDPVLDSPFGKFIENGTGAQIDGVLGDDEIMVTSYTAQRMGLSVGSNLTLNYSVYDESYRETFVFENFTVKYVVDIAGKADDPELMPPFPGIDGTQSCADWDPPMGSFDRSLMENEDLNYWQQYHGTPKAYVSLEKAKGMWSNDLGNITTVKVKPSVGANATLLAPELGAYLNGSIVRGDAGMTVSAVKLDGINSAKGVQILTETFLAFGAVVILAGLVLAVMLVSAMAEERKREMGTLRAVGSRRSQVTRIFLFEGVVLSSISSLMGTFAGLLIAQACVLLTNAYWSNMMEGTSVALSFNWTSLALGFAVGFVVVSLTFALSSHVVSGMRITDALKGTDRIPVPGRKAGASAAAIALGVILVGVFVALPDSGGPGRLAGFLGPALILMGVPFLPGLNPRSCAPVSAIAAIVYTLAYGALNVSGGLLPFELYFASGFVIVAASVTAISVNLAAIASFVRGTLEALRVGTPALGVALLNPVRRKGRTAFSIALFAVVIFTLISLSFNISGQQANLEGAVRTQGGGYDVLGEAAIPLRFDLGNESDRQKEGLGPMPSPTDVVSFLTFGSSGGTCTNLNKDLPPRLIGANATFVRMSEMRFASALNSDEGNPADVWSDLDEGTVDDAVPAIGDYNTVVWILQKGLGDRITITDEFGEERALVFVGILGGSIFPGSVFVSENNLDALYPTKAEYGIFLFRTGEPQELVSYLELGLSKYGMDARLVEEIVRDNSAVEWSYMSLFQALLVFGLVVGTAGLALRTSKAVLERRREIGTMRALGYSERAVLKVFLLEGLYIAVLGILVGSVAGLCVTLVFFGAGEGAGAAPTFPWLAAGVICISVLLASLAASAVPSARASRLSPAEALRTDE